MIFEDKNGNYKLVTSLTNKNNIASKNKKKSIIFEPTDSDKFSIEETNEKIKYEKPMKKQTKSESKKKNENIEIKHEIEQTESSKIIIPFLNSFGDKKYNIIGDENINYSQVSLPYIYLISFKNKDTCNIIEPPFTDDGLEKRKKLEEMKGVLLRLNNKLTTTLTNDIQLVNQGFKLTEKKAPKSILNVESSFTEEYISELYFKEENIKNRFTIISLSLAFMKDGREQKHQNNLIIDDGEQIIERFEPHGTKNLFANKWLAAFAKKNGYEFEHNMCGNLPCMIEEENFNKFRDSLPEKRKKEIKEIDDLFVDGIQALEGFSNFFDKMSGCCQIWSVMYSNLRILNPDTDPKELMRAFFKEMDYNVELISKYLFHYTAEMQTEMQNILGDKYLHEKSIFEIFEELKKHFSNKKTKKIGKGGNKIYNLYF